MKNTAKLYLLFGLLGLFNNSFAQIAQPLISPGSYQLSEYRTTTDQTLQDLDISPVTSKILYDRVFPAARLFEWSTSETSSSDHFVQAQAELYEASYNAFDKLRPDNFGWLLNQSLHEQVIPVGVIVSNFQMLNYDAIENDANGKVKLKSGYSTAQAYQTREVTVAALLAPSLREGTYTFKLADWATYVQHQGDDISNVQVNFGSGTQTFNMNGTAQASFYGQGTKTIYFTITLTNGTVLQARSTVEINNNECTTCREYTKLLPNSVSARIGQINAYPRNDDISKIDSARIEADISFEGYDEFSASRGSGDMLTYYASGREQLRKPMIVLDGFDPGDTRNAWNVYNSKLIYSNTPGITEFLGDELRENNPSNDLDVIILNFPEYQYQCITETFCPPLGGVFRRETAS